MWRELQGALGTKLLPGNSRPCGAFLVLIERIEKSEMKVMERDGMGMIMRAVRVPTYILAYESYIGDMSTISYFLSSSSSRELSSSRFWLCDPSISILTFKCSKLPHRRY